MAGGGWPVRRSDKPVTRRPGFVVWYDKPPTRCEAADVPLPW